MRRKVLLAWALDRDGAKVDARKLDPGARRARAPFRCPGCGEPLVPRLGPVRARHFAHLPGSSCPLTAPESALHLDAKERLLALCAEAFAGIRHVAILARCPSCRRPAPWDVARLGDHAEAEGAVGALRADVLVRRRGRPSLAIEVRVTHAVDPEKEAALAAVGLPAVEVDAREEWEGEADGAATVRPARTFGAAPCPSCVGLARAEEDRARGGEAAEVAELEAYRARGLLGAVRVVGTTRARRKPSAITRASAASPVGSSGTPGSAARGSAARAAAVGSSGTPGSAAGTPGSAAARTAAAGAAAGAGALGREAGRFQCPECGGREVALGERIARHACPGGAPRPIGWAGYDGSVILLGWWQEPRGSAPGGARRTPRNRRN